MLIIATKYMYNEEKCILCKELNKHNHKVSKSMFNILQEAKFLIKANSVQINIELTTCKI